MTLKEWRDLARAVTVGLTVYAVSVALMFGLFVLVVREDVVDSVLKNYAPLLVLGILATGFWVTLYALEFWSKRRDS